MYLYGIEIEEGFSLVNYYQSSNRTFMELKFGRQRDVRLPARRSNRTFMELKYRTFSMDLNLRPVLIVPLWN